MTEAASSWRLPISSGRWRLVYTDFAPNGLVARELVSQLGASAGIRMDPVLAPYGDYLRDRRHRKGNDLKLVLTAPYWTHPVGHLADVYLRYSGQRRDPAFTTFLDEFERSVGAETLADAVGHAVTAEHAFPRPARSLVYLASLRARLAHHGPNVWIPPSGWIDIDTMHRAADLAGRSA